MERVYELYFGDLPLRLILFQMTNYILPLLFPVL